MSCGCALAAPAGALGIKLSTCHVIGTMSQGRQETAGRDTWGGREATLVARPGEGDTPRHNFQGVAVANPPSEAGTTGRRGRDPPLTVQNRGYGPYGGAFAIRCGGTDGPRVRGNYALRLTNIIPKPRAACVPAYPVRQISNHEDACGWGRHQAWSTLVISRARRHLTSGRDGLSLDSARR